MNMEIYAVGLCCLSVCAPSSVPLSEITAFVNRERPTGIESLWQPSTDPTFKTGHPNPCLCNTKPDHHHYLFNC
jgi:hypothetical protein